MNSKMKALRSLRNSKGQLMASVDLMILIPATLVLLLFLLNAGVAMYYKQKVAFISIEAARYAAGLSDPNTAAAKTTEFVKALVREMGISCTAENVEVKKTSLAGRPGATVRVQLIGLTMIGNGWILPSVIPMEDTSSASDIFGGATLAQIAIKVRPKDDNNKHQYMYLPAVAHDDTIEQFWGKGLRLKREKDAGRFDLDNAFDDFENAVD